MPTGVEDGYSELVTGEVLTWSREELEAEAATACRTHASTGTYRVQATQDLAEGTTALYRFDVPGQWLHVFLFAWWGNRNGDGDRVISVDRLADA